MEPVSLLIGIVPLCAQLAKTTATINNLISTYKSAARELEALSNTLVDVRNVCESLGDILHTTDTSEYHPSETRLFAALHGRIQDCHDRVTDIQDIIQVVNGKRRGPFRNEGFLFLQFKDKISSCNKNLDKSLSSLNLVLATSHFIRLLQLPRTRGTILEKTNLPSQSCAAVTPDRPSIPGYVDTSPISTDVFRKSVSETTFAINNWQQSFLGLAFIAKIKSQKKTANIDGLGYSVIEGDLTFTAGSPFSKTSIKVCIKQDCFSPLYVTLQILSVIPVDHGSSSLGTRIRKAYSNDDPEEIRQLLEQRVVTPTTLLGWNGNYTDTGFSLLGLAAVLRAPRILALARSQMTAVEERHHFPDRSGVFKPMLTRSDLQCTVDYINMRKHGMSPDELHKLLTGHHTYSQLKTSIDAYLTWSSPARDHFHRVLGRNVLSFFDQPYLLKYNLEDWASFISEHIARGLDIYNDLHTDFDQNTSTLTAILRSPACSDIAISNLHLWLDVLELSGVDIEQYLRVETPRCVATWGRYRKEGSLINRALLLQSSRGRLIPYWRQEIHSRCPIRDLLVEFPRFLHPDTIDVLAAPMDTVRLRRAWKAGEDANLIYPEKISWPVAPRMAYDRRAPDLRHLTDVDTECKRAMEWLYREYHQRKRRHERKLERKMRKGAEKRKAHGKMSLPGAWVD